MRMTIPQKYRLYELSVQSPEWHAEWFVGVFKEQTGRYPRHLREDFCGTFRISCEWVKRNRRNTALALDLDKEPLGYGRRRNLAALNRDQKKRIQALRGDVLETRAGGSDLIIACNFSFFIF